MPKGMMIAFLPTDAEGQVMRRIMADDFSKLPTIAPHVHLG
jgi:hypothetical protein